MECKSEAADSDFLFGKRAKKKFRFLPLFSEIPVVVTAIADMESSIVPGLTTKAARAISSRPTLFCGDVGLIEPYVSR
jgi:hypothetical protein